MIIVSPDVTQSNENTRRYYAFVDKLKGCKFNAQLGAGEFAIADIPIPMVVAFGPHQTRQLSGSAKVKMRLTDYVEFDETPEWHLGYDCPGQ